MRRRRVRRAEKAGRRIKHAIAEVQAAPIRPYCRCNGFAALLLVMAVDGELVNAAELFSADSETLVYLVLMGTLTFMGISFYMTCIPVNPRI